MEKFWIKKELYILIYEFLKFYALFLNLIWFFIWFLEVFSIKNRKKGYYLQVDVASGPRRAADVARGTASGCDTALRPRGRARVARTGRRRHIVARPRGRRPRDHVVHVGARVGRHVAGW